MSDDDKPDPRVVSLVALAAVAIPLADAVDTAIAADKAAEHIDAPRCVAAFLAGAGYAITTFNLEINRVVRALGDDFGRPPRWAVELLQKLGMKPQAEPPDPNGSGWWS